MVLPQAIAKGEFRVQDYHETSKHRIGEYAPGPLALDWEQQPNPYRTFVGAPTASLPIPIRTTQPRYHQLFDRTSIPPAEPSLSSLSQFLGYSMGISCWKVHENFKYALRSNPSSGNLHPTETYLGIRNFAALSPGVYHYQVHDHALEQRGSLKHNNDCKDAELWIGLTSVPWREAWKYGERSYRYCQLDIGHAIGAIQMSAAALGWRVELVEDASDQQIAALLGIDRVQDYSDCERELPEVLLRLDVRGKQVNNRQSGELRDLIQSSTSASWQGTPTRLSTDEPVEWPLADAIPEKLEKPLTTSIPWMPEEGSLHVKTASDESATDLFYWRRSGQAFDAEAIYPQGDLGRLLETLVPRQSVPPLNVLPWEPRIHPVFFIHNVEGMRPGIYIAPRSKTADARLRMSLRERFDWEPVDLANLNQPFYRLVAAKCRKAARRFSCNQAIASDSCFSVAMLSDYDRTIDEGAWKYRQLFWEAGVLGQLMYLEAEVANFRGTGIGCFFDDEIHEVLGIQDTSFQCLYNFTVGYPILDPRLQTIPPYAHIQRS